MKLYSLSEIARELQVAASTLRYHANHYAEFLPVQEIEGERWPKYEEEAIALLQTIMDLVSEGRSREEIKEHLLETQDAWYQDTTVTAASKENRFPVKGADDLFTNMQGIIQYALNSINYQQELLEIKENRILDVEQEVARLERALADTQAALEQTRTQLESCQKWRQRLSRFFTFR